MNDAPRNLLGHTDDLTERWESVQLAFVDEPRQAVEDADRLVNDVTERLLQRFREQRHDLEVMWTSGQDVTTEDLRIAFQRYRSFFERLLAA